MQIRPGDVRSFQEEELPGGGASRRRSFQEEKPQRQGLRVQTDPRPLLSGNHMKALTLKTEEHESDGTRPECGLTSDVTSGGNYNNTLDGSETREDTSSTVNNLESLSSLNKSRRSSSLLEVHRTNTCKLVI